MKSETFLEIVSHKQATAELYREVDEQAQRLEELRSEAERAAKEHHEEEFRLWSQDPGPVAEVEPRSSLERFDAMMSELITLSKPVLNWNVSPPAPDDKSCRQTPTLPIEHEHEGEKITLELYLQIDTGGRSRRKSIHA